MGSGNFAGRKKSGLSLKNRLSLTYALFISIALLILTLVINHFAFLMFSRLVRNNINERSGEIVRAVAEQYNPLGNVFDKGALEAMGMHFVHEGYIVRVESTRGAVIWDARSCDMQQCADVIKTISDRMENQYRLDGKLQSRLYPVNFLGKTVGNVTIETYGPFFYSETELQFLSGLNRLLLGAGIFFTLLSVCISIPIASRIARPILRAGEAARHIARGNLSVRIQESCKTRELNELSRSINDLAGALEEGERRQKQLTGDVAHELRTPLTCLQGNFEAMIDGVLTPDRERLESCHEEIIRLVRLVKDLNLLSNLEGESEYHKSDFDLAKLAELTAGQFTGEALKKGISLVLDLNAAPLNADYNRIKQVLINLISNGLAYTDAGSVTVCVSPREGGAELSVRDTGIGIKAEELPRVFERFYRSDKSRNRGTGGAGIGLAIAAAIVKAHGGTITAESKGIGGEGSVFRVRIPALPVK
ncbi:MAG: HAMP domain-containing protein [Treponema sp.]|jgi:signal transduction histidine kinase|nr:HAMP domain-containing protein [Treponema sp.]